MDVAFVSDVVYPDVKGGAEKRIHEIGRRLVDRGHDVTVYGRHFWDGPAAITRAGMDLRAVSPERDLYAGDRRSIPEALEFAKDVLGPVYRNRDRHDLIVASVFPYFPVLAARVGLAFDDTPLLVTWHEVWREYWESYLGRLAPFGKGVEWLTARVSHYPVAVSQVTADRLAEIGPDRERITVVPNGIDVSQIRSISPAEDGFDVLFAGRLIEDKHVDILLRSFDRIAETHDTTLGIIGDGPQRTPLERLASACDHSERITFLGFLDDYEDVVAHMKAASIFASPSTREGFGISYLEAMAADCIVIGADHPDSAADEVIDNAGYVVEPSINALTPILDRTLEGERPPADPMATAREYDWSVVTDQAIEAYRTAVEQA